MNDIIVDSIKYIIDNSKPSLPFTVLWDKKDTSSDIIKARVKEDSVIGSISIKPNDFSTDSEFETPIVGLTFTDGYDNIYTIKDYNMGTATLDKSLLVDFYANDVFELTTGNVVKITTDESSTYDKVRQKSANSRCRKKPINVFIYTYNDTNGLIADKIAKYLMLLLLKENFQGYNGTTKVQDKVYLADYDTFNDMSKDINNRQLVGRFRYYIYEDLCAEIKKLEE